MKLSYKLKESSQNINFHHRVVLLQTPFLNGKEQRHSTKNCVKDKDNSNIALSRLQSSYVLFIDDNLNLSKHYNGPKLKY